MLNGTKPQTIIVVSEVIKLITRTRFKGGGDLMLIVKAILQMILKITRITPKSSLNDTKIGKKDDCKMRSS
jgi:hypothetical protein